MPLLVNIWHLETHSLDLKGELTAADLDIETHDEMIRVLRPLKYDLVAEKLPGSILVQGTLRITLDCRCVRCLEPFEYKLELHGPVCHLELQGEDKTVLVNDCADLTPSLREDILLEFPRQPVCKPECRGLPGNRVDNAKNAGTAGEAEAVSSVWSELSKLRF
jgi:uncharacterized protein